MMSSATNFYKEESTQTVQQGWARVVIQNVELYSQYNLRCNLPDGDRYLRILYSTLKALYMVVQHEFEDDEKERCKKFLDTAKKELETFETRFLNNHISQRMNQYDAYFMKRKNLVYDKINEAFEQISQAMKVHGVWRFLKVNLAEKTIEDWTER